MRLLWTFTTSLTIFLLLSLSVYSRIRSHHDWQCSSGTHRFLPVYSSSSLILLFFSLPLSPPLLSSFSVLLIFCFSSSPVSPSPLLLSSLILLFFSHPTYSSLTTFFLRITLCAVPCVAALCTAHLIRYKWKFQLSHVPFRTHCACLYYVSSTASRTDIRWKLFHMHYAFYFSRSYTLLAPLLTLHSTPLYSTLLHPTLLYSTLLYSTFLHSTPLHSVPLYSPPLCSTLLSSTLL